jgi:hypothetical protein
MKIHRALINPQTPDDLIVRLPERFLHSEIEIIAFPVEQEPLQENKRTYEQIIKFYRDNSIDFSKVKKWKREDLYE